MRKRETVDSRITVTYRDGVCRDVVRREKERKEGKRVREKIEGIGRAPDLIGEFLAFFPFRLSSFPSRSYLHYPST